MFATCQDILPEARFVRNLMVFDHPARGGFVARGFEIVIPDLGQASASVLNGLTHELQTNMHGIGMDERWQWQWSVEPFPALVLDEYEKATLRCSNTWSRLVRSEKVERFRDRLLQGKLNCHRVFLFRTRAMQHRLGFWNSEEQFRSIIDAQEAEFTQFGEGIAKRFRPFGIAVNPLDDAGHYLRVARFLNPSSEQMSDGTLLKAFDPSLTLEENCSWSKGAVGDDGQFSLDGHAQSMVLLSRLPEDLNPITMQSFTKLNLSRFQITVTIHPLSCATELSTLEKTMRRLRTKPETSRLFRDRAALEMNEKRAASIASGLLRPTRVRVACRLWGQNSRISDLSTVKEAILNLRGATYFQPMLPASVGNHFRNTVPGWSWGSYEPYLLSADNAKAAMLCPLSVSFRGSSGSPDVLMESEAGNPVNLSLFAGVGEVCFPRLSLLGGGTGAGKSTLLNTLAVEGDPHFSASVTMDFGGSLRVTAATKGSAVCVIRGGTALTVNYLVAASGPHGPAHIGAVNAMHQVILGAAHETAGPRLEGFVQSLYADSFDQWSRRDSTRLEGLARRCLVILSRIGPEVTFHEAWNDLHHLGISNPEAATSLLQGVSEAGVSELLSDPQRRHHLQNLSWAYMDEDLKPTLSALCDCVRLKARKDSSLRVIVDQLTAANRNSHLGGLLDGQSTYNLESTHQYLDLAHIPRGDTKQIAIAQLLASHIASYICYGLPRSCPKMFMIDEASAFLRQAPGTAEFTASVYQQARKYKIWLAWAFQNLTDLQGTVAWEPVLTNTQTFYLLKQDNSNEIELLRQHMGLSQRAAAAIASYPSPAVSRTPARFTYLQRDKPVDCCGTAVCELSKEMLYATATDGAHFETRQKALQNAGGNLDQGLLNLAKELT